MKSAMCPCCSRSVELVRDDVLAAHYAECASRGTAAGPRRAGPYCNGSGYTVEQAQRWIELSPADKERRLSSVWSVPAGTAVA